MKGLPTVGPSSDRPDSAPDTPAVEAEPGLERSEGVAPRTLRILIVEDEGITAMHIEDMVLELGHDVIGTASNGTAAVAAATAQRPDLVLMDITLAKGTDGVAAALEIQRTLGISSIFMTAHSDAGTKHRAQAAGPLGYLVKPFATEQLAALLSRL